MEVLRLPSNIKVHFAGSEVQNQYLAVKYLGVNYALYTAFPFCERMVFGKGKSPIMPQRWMTNPAVDIPKEICSSMKHVIQDSGLFTLMFGSRKGEKGEALINKWYDALIEFTLNHAQKATCVEVDCQKILGVEKAWEFRERMKKDLPNNRIINVFHLEDGRKGLDRLIEYSEYIAISVPELRFANKKNYVTKIAKYIKSKKPTIDIHLLGCTELTLLRENAKIATSADSTTYISSKRWGFIGNRHISSINTEKIRAFHHEVYEKLLEYNKEQNANFLIMSIEQLKRKYQDTCGNQDYKRI